MASNSQLAVPLSQNTAPVFKFDCLYTHDVVRKQKRWQDGILAFHTFNKRVMVYDLTSNFIGDTHWRDSDSVNVGDDLRLDRGVLVEVGEAKGRKEQDISEIFAKKTAQYRTQVSPISRDSSSVGMITRAPKPLSAVLAAGRSQIGKTVVPRVPSGPSLWSSATEADSPRPSKKPRLGSDMPSREALAPKSAVNQVSRRNSRSQEQDQQAKSDVSARNQFDSNGHKHGKSLPKIKKQSKSKQTLESRAESANSALCDSSPKTKSIRKTKAKAGHIDKACQQRPSRANDSQINSLVDDDPALHINIPTTGRDLSATNEPRHRLQSSRLRRKKLICHSLPVAQECSQNVSLRDNRESVVRDSGSLGQSKGSISTPRPCRQPYRDVILISSPPGEQEDVDISENDDYYVNSIHRKSSVRRGIRSGSKYKESPSRDTPTKVDTTGILQPMTARDHSIESEVDGDLLGLLEDSTILRELIDNPATMRSMDQKEESTKPSEISGVIDMLNGDSQVSDEVSNVITEAVDEIIQAKGPVPSSASSPSLLSMLGSCSPTSPNEPSEPLAFESPILIPASPPTQSVQSKSENIPQAKDDNAITIQPDEPLQSVQPTVEVLPEPPPVHQPRAFQPLVPALLNKPVAAPAPIPNQKPLPQFRQPQRTTRSTTTLLNNSNTKRSPLRKSLTVTYPGPSNQDTAQATLTRADSDGAVKSVTFAEEDYEQTGPWSREAFDLFGWTPDVSKGRALGPVASRGCGCRAAADAARKVLRNEG